MWIPEVGEDVSPTPELDALIGSDVNAATVTGSAMPTFPVAHGASVALYIPPTPNFDATIRAVGTATFLVDVAAAAREQSANRVSSTTQEQDAIAELRREVGMLRNAVADLRRDLIDVDDVYDDAFKHTRAALDGIAERLNVLEAAAPKPAVLAVPARREGWPGT